MTISPFLLLLVGVVIVGGMAVYRLVADGKRRERLFAAATAHGWTYVRELPELVGRWRGEPFDSGDNRRAQDVLTGEWLGRGFAAFTYSYETHTTDSKGSQSTTTHRFAVVTWTLPAWLPTLEVRPESLMHRALDAVGIADDIELESEDFNRAFRVRAGDRKYASDVLSARAMEVLLAGPRVPWRIENGSVLTWADGALEPDVVPVSLALLQQRVSLVPEFVWKDHGYDPPDVAPGV